MSNDNVIWDFYVKDLIRTIRQVDGEEVNGWYCCICENWWDGDDDKCPVCNEAEK